MIAYEKKKTSLGRDSVQNLAISRSVTIRHASLNNPTTVVVWREKTQTYLKSYLCKIELHYFMLFANILEFTIYIVGLNLKL